ATAYWRSAERSSGFGMGCPHRTVSIHLKSCDGNLRADGRLGPPAGCVTDLAVEEQRLQTKAGEIDQLTDRPSPVIALPRQADIERIEQGTKLVGNRQNQ